MNREEKRGEKPLGWGLGSSGAVKKKDVQGLIGAVNEEGKKVRGKGVGVSVMFKGGNPQKKSRLRGLGEKIA